MVLTKKNNIKKYKTKNILYKNKNYKNSKTYKKNKKNKTLIGGSGTNNVSGINHNKLDIKKYSLKIIKNINNVIEYNDMLNNYINNLSILKIPFISHYNNLSYYSNDKDNKNQMLQSCKFKFNNNDIYLVRQQILSEDSMNNTIVNYEFRPHSFYMIQENPFINDNLYFYGKLKIFNIKTKKEIQNINFNNINVNSHNKTFSPNANLISLDDLEIDINNLDDNNFFYYIEFTPDLTTITNPLNTVVSHNETNFPIFRGLYWISYMKELPITFDDIPQMENKLCNVISQKFKDLIKLSDIKISCKMMKID